MGYQRYEAARCRGARGRGEEPSKLPVTPKPLEVPAPSLLLLLSRSSAERGKETCASLSSFLCVPATEIKTVPLSFSGCSCAGTCLKQGDQIPSYVPSSPLLMGYFLRCLRGYSLQARYNAQSMAVGGLWLKLGKRGCFVLARKFPEEAYDCEVSRPAACSTSGPVWSPRPGVPAHPRLFCTTRGKGNGAPGGETCQRNLFQMPGAQRNVVKLQD